MPRATLRHPILKTFVIACFLTAGAVSLTACEQTQRDLVAFSDKGMGKDTPPWKRDAHSIKQNDPYMGGVPVVGDEGAVEVNSPVLAATSDASYDGPGASDTYQGGNTAYRAYSDEQMMRQPMAAFAVSSAIPSMDSSVTVFDIASTTNYSSTVYANNAYMGDSSGAPRPVVAEVDSGTPIYPSPFRRARLPQNTITVGRAGDEGTLTPMPLPSAPNNSGRKVSGVTGPKAYMPQRARLTGP